MPDEDSPWYIQLLVTTGVLIGVAVLVGAVVAVAGIKVADVAGITAPHSSSPETIVIPTPSTSSPSPSGGHHPTATRSPTHTRGTRPSPLRAITLSASPQQVSAYDPITLTGSYSAPDGTTLQVQRQEGGGGWLDFPTTTSVNGGTFSTYIETGRTGTNRLRVVDTSTGRMSNIVIVVVS